MKWLVLQISADPFVLLALQPLYFSASLLQTPFPKFLNSNSTPLIELDQRGGAGVRRRRRLVSAEKDGLAYGRILVERHGVAFGQGVDV